MNQKFIKKYVDEHYGKYITSDGKVYVPSIQYIYADFQYMFSQISGTNKKTMDLYYKKQSPKQIPKETNVTLTRVNEVINKYT